MTDVQRVQKAIRDEFPKHSKAAYSLASRTNETGVMLCPRAQEIKDAVTAHRTPRKDLHKLQHRLAVRVTKSRYEQVKRLIAEDGRFPTINAWLDWWVYTWVKQKEKAASGVAAPSAAKENYTRS